MVMVIPSLVMMMMMVMIGGGDDDLRKLEQIVSVLLLRPKRADRVGNRIQQFRIGLRWVQGASISGRRTGG